MFFITVKTLTMRRKKAADLKMQTDKAPSMNDHELAELRADIKVGISLCVCTIELHSESVYSRFIYLVTIILTWEDLASSGISLLKVQ